MLDKNPIQQDAEKDPEQADFPHVGYRARRWNRFERDLYEWMNRPEGQFECWLAARKVGTTAGAANS